MASGPYGAAHRKLKSSPAASFSNRLLASRSLLPIPQAESPGSVAGTHNTALLFLLAIRRLAHDADQNRNGFVSCGCNCAVTLCNPIELRVAVSVIHLAGVMHDKAIPKCNADIAGWTIPTLSGVAPPVTGCCSAATRGSGWGAQSHYALRIEAILHAPPIWGLPHLIPFSDLQNL